MERMSAQLRVRPLDSASLVLVRERFEFEHEIIGKGPFARRRQWAACRLESSVGTAGCRGVCMAGTFRFGRQLPTLRRLKGGAQFKIEHVAPVVPVAAAGAMEPATIALARVIRSVASCAPTSELSSLTKN